MLVQTYKTMNSNFELQVGSSFQSTGILVEKHPPSIMTTKDQSPTVALMG